MKLRSGLFTLIALAAFGCAAPEEDEAESAEGAATSAEAKLPECASPLMQSIFEATKSTIHRGSVPAELYATSHSKGHLTPLLRGPEIFPSMRQLIAEAKSEVDLQMFVFNMGNDPANDVLAGLSDLAARRSAEKDASGAPVLVRFIVDVTQVSGSARRAIPELARSVAALNLPPELVQVEIATFQHFALGNLHTKTLVVDGHEAIVTGANIQDQHNYAEPWFDTGYRFSGEVAYALRADFDQAWKKSKLFVCGATSADDPDERCYKRTTAIERTDAPAIAPSLEKVCVPMLVTTRAKDSNPFSNRTDNTQDRAFVAAITNAQRVVRIHTPNLNDDAAKKAIVGALEKNPELVVEIVLSKGFNESAMNLPGQGGGNESNAKKLYDELARKQVPRFCERLRIRWYSHDGVEPVVGNGPYASHAKYASFDDHITIVGSANMDTQAWNNSREVNVAVDSEEVTRAWDDAVFKPSFNRGIDARTCETDPEVAAP